MMEPCDTDYFFLLFFHEFLRSLEPFARSNLLLVMRITELQYEC
jgi:hypothetical protein